MLVFLAKGSEGSSLILGCHEFTYNPSPVRWQVLSVEPTGINKSAVSKITCLCQVLYLVVMTPIYNLCPVSGQVHSLKVRKFCDIFWFSDDLCVNNDNSKFVKNFKDPYPEKLELKKGNTPLLQASFLDLSIHIEENKFNNCLFGKRDTSSFSIVCMLSCDSNLLSKIF